MGGEAERAEAPEQGEAALPIIKVLFDVHPYALSDEDTVKPMVLEQLPSNEMVATIRSTLMEAPTTCFCTAFKLMLKDDEGNLTEMSDFIELDTFEPVAKAQQTQQEAVVKKENGGAAEDGDEEATEPQPLKLSVIMQKDLYDVKKVRAHVKRLREVMTFPPASSGGIIPGLCAKGGMAKTKSKPKTKGKGKGKNKGPKKEKESTTDSVQSQVVDEQQPAPEEPKAGSSTTEEELARKAREAREARELQVKLVKALDPPIPGKPLTLEGFYDAGLALAADLSKFDSSYAPPGSSGKPFASVSFSGWNPPPAQRRMVGDVAYLEVHDSGKGTALHITASVKGFYVNGTRSGHFDPEPAARCCMSHDLLTCLLEASPFFAEGWEAVVSQATQRQATCENSYQALIQLVAAGKLDAATIAKQWNVPKALPGMRLEGHMSDINRLEDDLGNGFGVEDRGALRDWNEEYRSVCEWACDTSDQAIIKARALYKVLSDYREASIAGAKAITEGHILSINGMEPPHSQVFVFNNIFFSFAVDSPDAYRAVSGDFVAYKSARHDLHCVSLLSRISSGINTLATALVDYLGQRVVCQSIIPGILQGDHTKRLIVGAVEHGQSLRCDPEMLEMLQEVGQKLMIAERVLPAVPVKQSANGQGSKPSVSANGVTSTPAANGHATEAANGSDEPDVVTLCGAVELKGIAGADGRKYVLEVGRLTPRDANWVVGDKGTGVWQQCGRTPESDSRSKELCNTDVMAVLRRELVQSFVRERINVWASEMRAKLTEDRSEKLKAKAKAKADAGAEADPANGAETEEDLELSPDEVAKLKDAEKDFIKSLALNVNIFMPYTCASTLSSEAAKEIEADEALAREVAKYLWDQVLPTTIAEVKRGAFCPADGDHLCEMLHSRGINLRYLGRLADMAIVEEAEDRAVLCEGKERRWRMPLYFLEMLEVEMIARASKHLVIELFKQCPEARSAPGPTLVLLLNCLLGTSALDEEVKPATAGDAPSHIPDELLLADPHMTHESCWARMTREVEHRYFHTLSLWGQDGGDSDVRATKLQLLRRVCIKLGLRLTNKVYDFDAATPVEATDLLDAVPTHKSCVPPSPSQEATHCTELARAHMAAGNLRPACELSQHACHLLQQICSGMHKDFPVALEVLAQVLFKYGDPEAAVAQQEKALMFHVQVGGFDCADVTSAHDQLAMYAHQAGQFEKAIMHARTVCYLRELQGGAHHPTLSTAYLRLGQIYQEAENPTAAMLCYQESLKREMLDRAWQAQIQHQLARLFKEVGRYKDALNEEKGAFQIYSTLYGHDHSTAVAVGESLKELTHQAVKAANDQVKLSRQQQQLKAEAQANGDGPTKTKKSKGKKKKKKPSGAREVGAEGTEQQEQPSEPVS